MPTLCLFLYAHILQVEGHDRINLVACGVVKGTEYGFQGVCTGSGKCAAAQVVDVAVWHGLLRNSPAGQ